MYRRLDKNPNYYNLEGRTGLHINEHLSELIENCMEQLEKAKCITVDDEEDGVEPANLGRIAAFYQIRYETMAMFAEKFDHENAKNLKKRELLEILCEASEFESIATRDGEEGILREMAELALYRLPDNDLTKSSNKVNLLLQS